MKKIYSFLVFLLATSISLYAQTITVHLSGTVLRDSTLSPVVNHELIIQADSNMHGFYFYTSRFTNQNGHYDCTINNVPATGTAINFNVQTKNCDSTWIVQTFVGTTAPDTVNFLICNGNSTGCQAAFTYSVDTVSSSDLVYFYDQSTPTDSITAWHWDFGDGASVTKTFPDNPNVSHMYLIPGTYSVCLTIATFHGCSSQICHSITVGNNAGCHANYSYTVDSSNHLKLHFVDISTPQNLVTSRLWNFGDPASGAGNISTNFDPWHEYVLPGVYQVCLSIATSTGCTSTYCDSITVGTNPTSWTLNGQVYLGDSLFVDHGLAELLQVDSGVVTVVTSQQFGDSLGMYWFNGVLPGHYYIRATLLSTSAYYGQYVPTYYHDAVNWGNATLIELGQPVNPYNIHMHHASGYSSGSGNISGTINQGGKYNIGGAPAPNVEVLLMDVSGNVMAFTMTNSSGAFSFTEMALGTYKVYPEMILKTTTPTTITLDATHPNVNVIFTIQAGNISGTHDESIQSDFTISGIYPNPVSDFANLNIQTLHATGIIISIYSITGELVTEATYGLHSGTNKITIPVSDFRKGLYYIKVEKPDGGIVVKKFVLGR